MSHYPNLNNIILPPPSLAVGNYSMSRIQNHVLYTSGHIPLDDHKMPITGIVGQSVSLKDAVELARRIGLQLLSTLQDSLGNLDRIEQIIKITGFVSAVSSFTEHAVVLNGCSDLMCDVFGQAGKSARSAVGVATLPLGVPVEIELIAAIKH